MQALTIAIGKKGITFFIGHYLLPTIQQLMGQLKPPDRTMNIPDFGWFPSPFGQVYYSGILITMNNGVFYNFNSVYQGFSQGQTTDNPPVNLFTLTYQADNFHLRYDWLEQYTETDSGSYRGHSYRNQNNYSKKYAYSPVIGSLTIPIAIQFVFSQANNEWEMNVRPFDLPPIHNLMYNIPGKSILNNQDSSCSGNHANDTTMQMLSNVNLVTTINGLITGTLASIPGSGNLGNGIQFDFSVGDAGLAFPNNDGIQIAVKGGASYQGTAYDAPPPAPLPLPVPPGDADEHHLYLYVSSYEVDALSWAFFKAGQLDLLVQPDQIPNPEALKVKSYVSMESALQPYEAFVMFAQIEQNTAPVTSFQTVYYFDTAVMNQLKTQLPASIDQLIQGLQGNAYVSQTDLDNFLQSATVPASYFSVIADAGKISAMVLTQDLNFTLLIQNGQTDAPNIKFEVKRVDILTDLALGISPSKTQSMQFGFANATNVCTFQSSSIPGFNGDVFAQIVWPVTAEYNYAANLVKLGQEGVPLPIMKGFQ
ncbi:MAG: hypothetical protein IT259_07455, partial [Saprospiraceae bacterium]|nr:hypothetical protein [Saprospiraceae bacterium]